MITLGQVYRDKITGFEGVAISRHEYLNGCVRIAIQPQTLKDGAPIKDIAFDQEQLEVVVGSSVASEGFGKKLRGWTAGVGGPHDDDSQRPAVPGER